MTDIDKKRMAQAAKDNEVIKSFIDFVVEEKDQNGMEAVLWKNGEMEVISENTVSSENEDYASKISLDESLFEYDSEDEMRKDLDFDIRCEFRGME